MQRGGFSVIGLCCLTLTSCSQPVATADNPAELQAEIQKLLAARVETAQKAAAASQAAYEAGTIELSQLLAALDGLARAELDGTPAPQARIQIHEQIVARSRKAEDRIKQLYDQGARGGEHDKYFTAKLARETAEIDLLKARLDIANGK